MNTQNKFKELRAIFRGQWKHAMVDLDLEDHKDSFPYLYSKFCWGEVRQVPIHFLVWIWTPSSQEGSCTSTYFGVPVYYPPTHTAPFRLLLSIPINAKATINREVHFVLIQYPRASYEKTLTAWSRVTFSDLRHCHTENRLSFLGVFYWSFVGPILEEKIL